MKQTAPRYALENDGSFVIDNYLSSRPFANFFPGIAGTFGIPMWVFYVNRGQGICGFGTSDKDHSFMEFFPANKAWQFASSLGFRTFLRIGGQRQIYEPFRNEPDSACTSRMVIRPAQLQVEETNPRLGLRITVDYFTIPHEPFAGLARMVKVTNLKRSSRSIQMLDGLPQVVPFGTSNLFLKKLGRTVEAWMTVKNLKRRVPFYKIDVDPVDRPEIIHIKEGNFYLPFAEDAAAGSVAQVIVDPQLIFGERTDFGYPHCFARKQAFSVPARQLTDSKTPCAFSLHTYSLAPGEGKTFCAVFGYARTQEALDKAVRRIRTKGYLRQKRDDNTVLIDGLQKDIFTRSSSAAFDRYAQQTYLDNILRGGYPQVLSSGDIFYLYSRKHGDLERDYNKFSIQATYFSQGNGNYRDVNQNRRSDIWFNPLIKDATVKTLINLLQTDGYNPLVVKGALFSLRDESKTAQALDTLLGTEGSCRLIAFLKRPFTPGEIVHFIEENLPARQKDRERILDVILKHSGNCSDAEHGEGFWTDHWTYNLDIIESYLGIFPEDRHHLLFEDRTFTYFDNTETVKPRREKYLFYEPTGTIKQLHSLACDGTKRELIRKRAELPHAVRTQYGHGNIYRTSLFDKLCCLLANKIASLDPSGIGIEMEAEKPNWYDALNGLPGLFGSSLNETFELKRLAVFLREALANSSFDTHPLTREVGEFLKGLDPLLRQSSSAPDSTESLYQYWDASATLKEDYRHKTRLGVSGETMLLSKNELLDIISSALLKLERGIARARCKGTSLYHSYFMNEVTRYQTTKAPFVRALAFKSIPLPLFLEAQVHALRTCSSRDEALRIHRATRKSPLFDRTLKMYKVTAPLEPMPLDIGRCRAFPPGWLENESIWLHMEYKYLLELLKQGLPETFYEEFRNCLVCFQPPERYGRNVLENSSFLVSSAFSDPSLHGNGYAARLSGSTAEFIQIWLFMNIGQRPFRIDERGALSFVLEPSLARWLFRPKEKDYSFNFLKNTRITYHNPKMKDTFGKNGVRVRTITLSGAGAKPVVIDADTIPAPYALQLRQGLINAIDVELG